MWKQSKAAQQRQWTLAQSERQDVSYVAAWITTREIAPRRAKAKARTKAKVRAILVVQALAKVAKVVERKGKAARVIKVGSLVAARVAKVKAKARKDTATFARRPRTTPQIADTIAK